MLTRAGFAFSSTPAASQRQIPYGAFVTNERKFTSDRRRPSCAERNAALNQQISNATKTNRMRCMMALRYSAGECPPASEKYALTVNANDVATSPGFHPPYHALTIMATAKTNSRLSTTSESINAGNNARQTLYMSTPCCSAAVRDGEI